MGRRDTSRGEEFQCFLCDWWWLILLIFFVVVAIILTKDYWGPLLGLA